MVIARKKIIHEGVRGTYHVYNRTIRRAFLAGLDTFTGIDFSYRKTWVENRIKYLAGAFSIEVGGYAILSNHYHLILRTRPDIAENWAPDQVAERWWQLFPRRRDKFGNPEDPKGYELDQILFDEETGDPLGKLETLRKRLMSISWFMRCLNEFIAKKANHEDQCTGRFWEGRFKSTHLLDQAAVLACLAYVDLNPIHAGIALTPEESDFTSAQKRIEHKVSKERLKVLRAHYKQRNSYREKTSELEAAMVKLQHTIDDTRWLCQMSRLPLDQAVEGVTDFLHMDLDEYLELLDWTGRQSRPDKNGKIPRNLENILKRLEIDSESWLKTVKSFDNWFTYVAGSVQAIRKAALKAGKKWFAGINGAKSAFT